MNFLKCISFLLLVSTSGILYSHYPFCGNDLYYGEPTSTFINRWSFQKLGDHVFDPRTGKHEQPTTRDTDGVTFDPKKVRLGDIIFVRNIDLFMKTLHPKIKVPYIMLTHGDYLDTSYSEDLRYLDDEKIIAWFSIHPPKDEHPKYYPIPLGVWQKKEIACRKKHYSHFFQRLRALPKTKLLTGIFFTVANDERKALAKAMRTKSFFSPTPIDIPFDTYMEEMALSVFTLSPRGWGADCYRTWEALLVGTIPIVRRGQYGLTEVSKKIVHSSKGKNALQKKVLHSQLDRLYEQLPILVIDDWDEITESFLCEKYKQLSSKKYNIEKLYIDYWHSVMKTVRDNYISDYKRLGNERYSNGSKKKRS